MKISEFTDMVEACPDKRFTVDAWEGRFKGSKTLCCVMAVFREHLGMSVEDLWTLTVKQGGKLDQDEFAPLLGLTGEQIDSIVGTVDTIDIDKEVWAVFTRPRNTIISALRKRFG